ncbi:hypothetical protein GCM10025867_02560 [Frondihabitans sucicola]|uniref:Protein-glutamine gamma-glutamyltransferase-like C-terminal domain-containing protein n=1 Tax=Frondihabitans sucicola TaxID=1268041 RepID=A0ABN6XWI5_9MICO|nr:DUF4129 domain-containing protein [Frondihabitans sucicola]BDZ48015.1 hypothetical protein GCM10025867_02560 [Frondihabitans sucicola]
MDPTGTDTEQRTRRAPVAVLIGGALAVLIAVGAAVGGSLRFSGPRWFPGITTTPRPIVQSNSPQPVASQTPPPAPTAHDYPNLTWLVLLIAGLALAAVLFFVVRWLIRRRRDRVEGVAAPLEGLPVLLDLPDDPSVETSLPYLRRGLRRALAALDGDRSPADAIIEAWLGLQEAAEDAGFQRADSETPTEFTSRILRRVEVDPVALSTLRRLYLAVRFGDARATSADVAAARGALEILQAHWESAEPSADGGTP